VKDRGGYAVAGGGAGLGEDPGPIDPRGSEVSLDCGDPGVTDGGGITVADQPDTGEVVGLQSGNESFSDDRVPVTQCGSTAGEVHLLGGGGHPCLAMRANRLAGLRVGQNTRHLRACLFIDPALSTGLGIGLRVRVSGLVVGLVDLTDRAVRPLLPRRTPPRRTRNPRHLRHRVLQRRRRRRRRR
jgi:hypothetical protein